MIRAITKGQDNTKKNSRNEINVVANGGTTDKPMATTMNQK